MSMLLRRTMLAFGVVPEEVRIVATSATIGEGPEAEQQLREFISNIGGVPINQVDVVIGQRQKAELGKTR